MSQDRRMAAADNLPSLRQRSDEDSRSSALTSTGDFWVNTHSHSPSRSSRTSVIHSSTAYVCPSQEPVEAFRALT